MGKPATGELLEVEISITGFGLATQVDLVSAAEVDARSAGSSIEQETSLDSDWTIRWRVWANAVEVLIPRARKAIKALTNSFGQTINGEVPSPS